MLGLAQPLPDPHFIRPVARVKVGSGVGPRTLNNGAKQFHPGLDIAVPNGTVVQAVGPGEVIRLQKDPKADGGGIHIAIRHPNGMVSRYLHMMAYNVELGQKVTQGQRLGLSNNTGDSEGPHLHFELRVPEEMLARVEATVGKPTVGWGGSLSNYGIAIFPDSWIPVDEYRPSTLANVRKYKVPLYGEWDGSGGTRVSNFAKLPASTKIAGVAGIAALGLLLGVGLYRRRGGALSGVKKRSRAAITAAMKPLQAKYDALTEAWRDTIYSWDWEQADAQAKYDAAKARSEQARDELDDKINVLDHEYHRS